MPHTTALEATSADRLDNRWIQKGYATTYRVAKTETNKLTFHEMNSQEFNRTILRQEGGEYYIHDESTEQRCFNFTVGGHTFMGEITGDTREVLASTQFTHLFGNYEKDRLLVLVFYRDEQIERVHFEANFRKNGTTETIDIQLDQDFEEGGSLIQEVTYGHFEGPKGNLFFTDEEQLGLDPVKPAPYKNEDEQKTSVATRITGRYDNGGVSIYPLLPLWNKVRLLTSLMNHVPLSADMLYGFPKKESKLQTHYELSLPVIHKVLGVDFSTILLAHKEGHPDEKIGLVVALDDTLGMAKERIVELYVKGNVEFNIHLSPSGSFRGAEAFFNNDNPSFTEDDSVNYSTIIASSGKNILTGYQRRLMYTGFNDFQRNSKTTEFPENSKGEHPWQTDSAKAKIAAGIDYIEEQYEQHGLEPSSSIY